MKPMINIALPKGRLGEKVYGIFEAAGYACPEIREENRKLTFENPETGVRYFWVKPSDVAIYVERGAADLGVAGKDILLEYKPDIYELLDLGIGKCRMCVAGPAQFRDDPAQTLRVATKFQHIAQSYYAAQEPRIGHHPSQRLDRAGPDPRPFRRHRRYRRDGQDASGKRPGAAGDHLPHQRPADRQQGGLEIPPACHRYVLPSRGPAAVRGKQIGGTGHDADLSL